MKKRYFSVKVKKAKSDCKNRTYIIFLILLILFIAGAYLVYSISSHPDHPYSSKELERYIALPDYEKIVAEGGDENSGSLETQVWNNIVLQTRVNKYPQLRLYRCKQRAEKYYEDMAANFGYKDDNFSEFLDEYMSMSEDDYDKLIEDYSKEILKEEMTVYAIAEEKGIGVTDEEYESHLAEYLDSSGYTAEEYKKEFGITIEKYAEQRGIRTSLLKEKVCDNIFNEIRQSGGNE